MSHITQKVFDPESLNLTEILISMCSCAPGYFLLDIFREFAIHLVKIYNFQHVLHVTQNVFDLES
jgi:hypothetical protein